jgi:hypothetical protein
LRRAGVQVEYCSACLEEATALIEPWRATLPRPAEPRTAAGATIAA